MNIVKATVFNHILLLPLFVFTCETGASDLLREFCLNSWITHIFHTTDVRAIGRLEGYPAGNPSLNGLLWMCNEYIWEPKDTSRTANRSLILDGFHSIFPVELGHLNFWIKAILLWKESSFAPDSGGDRVQEHWEEA